MKSGIYKITFPNGQFYIGQSVDCDRRWTEHEEKFKRGTAAVKLQRAAASGSGWAEVIHECHPDHLNILENYYINKLKPPLNSTVKCSISEDEFNLLMSKEDLLYESIVDLVKEIVRLEGVARSRKAALIESEWELESIEREIDKEKLSIESYAKLVEEREVFDLKCTEYEQTINNLVDQLTLEQRRPWWKKLLGI